MPLEKVAFLNFRNLHNSSISLAPKTTIFYGCNGSGKTSILEALYYLSVGKSFRTLKAESIIKEGEEGFVLFSSAKDTNGVEKKVGIERKKDKTLKIKIDGVQISTISQLANHLPVLIVEPATFELLIGSPAIRRRYLDWGVFHVEHSYGQLWNVYNKCLKQRNTLLRHGKIERHQLHVWEREMVNKAKQIDAFRESYISTLIPLVNDVVRQFGINDTLDISYYRGWNTSVDYGAVLDNSFERDRLLKYTQFGPHKADIKIRVNGKPAQDFLSRGQQKVVVCSLVMAQAVYLQKFKNCEYLFLADDISAELDEKNRATFFEFLNKQLTAQVLLTAVDKEMIVSQFESCQDAKMFHVEHGRIQIEEQ